MVDGRTNPVLELAQERTRRGWDLAEELGTPYPKHKKVWKSVFDELKYSEWNDPPAHIVNLCLSIAELVSRWAKSRNPYYMDAAIAQCSKWGAPITSTIQHEFIAAAELRIRGCPAGTPNKVKKEAMLESALMLMVNLHIAGLSVAEASRKAQTYSGDTFMASGLARRYGERMRPIEADMRKHIKKWIPHHKKIWQPTIESLEDPPE